MPASALLRAYRIGSARFQDWCLEELGRSTDNASIVSAAALRIAEITSAYIDKVSEELLSAYEAGKEGWLRNRSVARAARVQVLLRGERYKVPREVYIENVLPKNAVGKIAKPMLRERLRAERG